MAGLVVDGTGFEVLVGDERIGPRRVLEPADVRLLEVLAARYVRAVQTRSDAGVFVELGRELYGWLEGDQGQLSLLLERAASPLVFEVRGPRSPSDRAWAVLRAPFELLARPGGGFLAADELLRFCVVRRLDPAGQRPGLDGFRLGLAFMASSPQGQHELAFEAEEAAILRAVGDSRVDLVVDDTGDPEQQLVGTMSVRPRKHRPAQGRTVVAAEAGPCGATRRSMISGEVAETGQANSSARTPAVNAAHSAVENVSAGPDRSLLSRTAWHPPARSATSTQAPPLPLL